MSKGKTILALVCLLCLWLALCARGQPMSPKLLIVPDDPETNWYFFAATAQDKNGLESDYSNEVSTYTTNQNGPVTVTLAWDRSRGTNVITNYAVYQGTSSRSYTNKVNAGTELTVQIVISPPRYLTVVTFSLTNGPSITLTNPEGTLLVRGRAWKVFSTRWPTVLEACSVTPHSAWTTIAGPVTNTSQPKLVVRLDRRAVLR